PWVSTTLCAATASGTMSTLTRTDAGAAQAPPPSRKPKSLWSIYSIAASLVIVFVVLTPLLICLWGSFTTISTMGAASTHSGAGWAAGHSGPFGAGSRDTEGPVTLLWYKYVFDVYGHTLLLSLKLAALCIVITIALGVFGGYEIG